MLPELRSAVDDAVSDRGGYGQVRVGKQSADADDRCSCLGREAASESTEFPFESWAWKLPSLPPIASAWPESSISVAEGPTPYNPNLSDEEPLFSASIVELGSAFAIPTGSSASHGPPACRR